MLMRDLISGVRSRVIVGSAVLVLGFAISLGLSAPPNAKPYTTWSDYGGSADSSHYSALDRINKQNVAKLEQAWFYPARGPTNRFAFNPVIADNFMYVLKPGDPSGRRNPRRPRDQLLGKQRSLGPAVNLHGQQLPAGDQRAHRHYDQYVRQRR